MKTIAIAGITCLLLSPGNSGLDEIDTSIKTGIFVDSNVSGLNYQSGNETGITNDGDFNYKDGESIVFGIGALSLGTVSGKDLITPTDFINSTTVARLLQTLDDDANPDNGIVITEDIRNSSALTGADSLLVDIDSQESTKIISELTSLTTAGERDVVTTVKAKEHMTKYTSYASIDKKVTGGTVNKSAWDTSYGYNQYYGEDLLDTYPSLPNYHAGIDISAPNGTSIYSLTSGTVSRVKDSIGAVYIKPEDQNGTVIYMHLSEIDVKKDDVITQDMKIGKSGKKGTGSYHLHIEWIKDGTYKEDEKLPTEPKEISTYNQGTKTTITDVTYDLKDLTYKSIDEEDASFNGTWVSSATQIPLADTSTFTKTLEISDGVGNYTIKYTQNVHCGLLVAESTGQFSYIVNADKLDITFTQEMVADREECYGFWVATGGVEVGSTFQFKRVKLSNDDTVIKDDVCAYAYNGDCVMEAQPYIKQ